MIIDQERRAKSILDHPEKYTTLGAWPDFEVVFRIWRYPALTAYSSWSLRQRGDDYYVRRLQWDRFKDSRRPKGEPTIYGSEAPLPGENAGPLLQRLGAIVLPPFVEAGRPGVGLDGVFFGVETRSFYSNRSLSWWCDPPKGWEALAEWLEETAGLFDSLLPESTAQMNE